MIRTGNIMVKEGRFKPTKSHIKHQTERLGDISNSDDHGAGNERQGAKATAGNE